MPSRAPDREPHDPAFGSVFQIVNRAFKRDHKRWMSDAEKAKLREAWNWAEVKYAELPKRAKRLADDEREPKRKITDEVARALQEQYDATWRTLRLIREWIGDDFPPIRHPRNWKGLQLVEQLHFDLLGFLLVGWTPNDAHAPRTAIVEVSTALAQHLIDTFKILEGSACSAAATWASSKEPDTKKITGRHVKDNLQHRRKTGWLWGRQEAALDADIVEFKAEMAAEAKMLKAMRKKPK